MMYPATAPVIKPMTTGKGIAAAGGENDTPATKTIASIPSRKMVMNSKINMTYFSIKSFSRFCPDFAIVGASRAFASFTRTFLLQATNAKQARAHNCDDEGGDDAECALIVVLMRLPRIASHRIEHADDGRRYDHAEEKSKACTEPYLKAVRSKDVLYGRHGALSVPHLPAECVINRSIAVRPIKCLLQESEQNGHNDCCFEGLAEYHNKNGDCEDIRCHTGRSSSPSEGG